MQLPSILQGDSLTRLLQGAAAGGLRAEEHRTKEAEV
jgi:hypothetical protein